MMDYALKRHYNPKSHYQVTFRARETPSVMRPGLAVPATILPVASSVHPDIMISVNKKDYIVPKKIPPTNIPKHVGNLRVPGAPFQDTTSYKLDFPQRPFDPNPMANTLMRTTMPRIIEVKPSDNYQTTNQSTLRKWSGNNKPQGYKEVIEQPLFTGEFKGESVTAKDFSGASVENGRPSSIIKREDVRQEVPEGFDEDTEHKVAFKLPQITERDPPQLKNSSRRHEETMDPKTGGMSSETQYRGDSNPKFRFHVGKRGMSLPQVDNLQLFQGPFKAKSEQKVSYTADWGGHPQPLPSFKGCQKESLPIESGKFDDRTTTGQHFQPVSVKKSLEGLHASAAVASKARFESEDSHRVRDLSDFGFKFSDNKPVNQTDYFQFWKTVPRVRHGDTAERIYHPSAAKFVGESETKTSFLPVKGELVLPCEGLDSRFQKAMPKSDAKMNSQTAYMSEYVPKPLPQVSACPAEMLMIKK